MNTTHTEILSALVDGEPVDPGLLTAALDDPDARAALVDFVRLRDAARDAGPLPASLTRMRQPPAARRLLRWTAAAAVLALMFVAGLFAPQPWRGGSPDAEAPPQPSRVEKFVPGVDWHQGD